VDLRNNSGQVVHIFGTSQWVLALYSWEGLAMQLRWPRATDFSGLTTFGLKACERGMSTPPVFQQSIAPFTFNT